MPDFSDLHPGDKLHTPRGPGTLVKKYHSGPPEQKPLLVRLDSGNVIGFYCDEVRQRPTPTQPGDQQP